MVRELVQSPAKFTSIETVILLLTLHAMVGKLEASRCLEFPKSEMDSHYGPNYACIVYFRRVSKKCSMKINITKTYYDLSLFKDRDFRKCFRSSL
ncbi:hypothetical protein GCK32_009315 [Trichostrongylus colubriformis]|uniref:Uncharacterized protein n=1 Tax=Trichostrongylus colubriformis TaxID=6319 RepID=A0AAN8F8B5_TRICO